MCRCGSVEMWMWRFGDVELWRCVNMEMCRCGSVNVEMCRCVDVEIWSKRRCKVLPLAS